MAKMAIKDRLVNSKGSPQPLLLLIFSLLLLRSRLITGPKELLRNLQVVTSKHRVSEEELSRALQQLYVKDSDGTQRLLVPHEGRIKQVRLLFSDMGLFIPRYMTCLFRYPFALYPRQS